MPCVTLRQDYLLKNSKCLCFNKRLMMKHYFRAPVIFLFAPLFGLCFGLFSGLVGCATLFQSKSSQVYELRMRGDVGRKEVTEYISKSLEQKYVNTGVMREQESTTKFSVSSTLFEVSKEKNYLRYAVESLSHEGAYPLVDLAFPEVGQPMEFILSSEGKVLKAGEYPVSSAFYVAPIPLPAKPVAVGDSWNFSSEWVNISSGVPFIIHLTVIFKDIEKCGNQNCAHLEISGNVALNVKSTATSPLASEVSGHMNFGLTSGSLVSGEVRTSDKIQMNDELTIVSSCLGIRQKSQTKKQLDCTYPTQ